MSTILTKSYVHTSLLLLALLPSMAYAHDGDWGGVVLGILGGIPLGIVATLLLPFKPLGKVLSFIPVTIATCVLGIVVGSVIQEGINRKKNADYTAIQSKKEALIAASAFNKVACAGDDAALSTFLRSTKLTDDVETIYQVGDRCKIWSEPCVKGLLFPQSFPLVARELHRREASEQIVNPNVTTHYCELLTQLHTSRATAFLQSLRQAALPIFCAAPMPPGWYGGLRDSRGFEYALDKDRQRVWEWLMLVKDAGADFTITNGYNRNWLVNQVVECGEPRLIRFVLESSGTTPDFANPERDGATLAIAWHTRRITDWRCSLSIYNSPSELADIAEINRRIPDLQPAIINRKPSGNHQSLLWEVSSRSSAPSGGAGALLTYLLARGAKLDHEDLWGHNFMHSIGTIPPELRVELDKLTDAQVAQLLNSSKDPLLDYSRKFKRPDIEAFLCSRKVKGC
jgi:hypothetical protein